MLYSAAAAAAEDAILPHRLKCSTGGKAGQTAAQFAERIGAMDARPIRSGTFLYKKRIQSQAETYLHIGFPWAAAASAAAAAAANLPAAATAAQLITAATTTASVQRHRHRENDVLLLQLMLLLLLLLLLPSHCRRLAAAASL